MNCEQCDKEIEINASCWYNFSGGDIICDDCHNKNLSEMCESSKGFKDKITKAQTLIKYAMLLLDFASENEEAKEQFMNFLNNPTPPYMTVLTMDWFIPMAVGFILDENKITKKEEKNFPTKKHIEFMFKRMEKINKDLNEKGDE